MIWIFDRITQTLIHVLSIGQLCTRHNINSGLRYYLTTIYHLIHISSQIIYLMLPQIR